MAATGWQETQGSQLRCPAVALTFGSDLEGPEHYDLRVQHFHCAGADTEGPQSLSEDEGHRQQPADLCRAAWRHKDSGSRPPSLLGVLLSPPPSPAPRTPHPAEGPSAPWPCSLLSRKQRSEAPEPKEDEVRPLPAAQMLNNSWAAGSQRCSFRRARCRQQTGNLLATALGGPGTSRPRGWTK